MTIILPDDIAAFERQLTMSDLGTIVGKLETAGEHLFDQVACAGVEHGVAITRTT